MTDRALRASSCVLALGLLGCGGDTSLGPPVHPAGGCAEQSTCEGGASSNGGTGPACGQTSAGDGPAWANWPMPNPATKGLPHAASYDLGAASVVIDNVTGLMWQKEGFLQLSPEEAASQCAELELDGHCDWRLPTRIELVSLVDFSRDMVAFDPAAFPGAQGEYLSASLLDGHRFFVGSDGATRLRTQTQVPRGSARCVRRHREEPAPEPRYTFAGQAPNDTVRDHGTGLVWQRRPSDSTYTFDEAQDYCAALVIDGGGFRAPSMKELQTLLDERRDSGPPIDADVFPGFPATLNATFWTSSRSARSEANAWFVRGGSTLDAAVDAGVEASFYVRCVK